MGIMLLGFGLLALLLTIFVVPCYAGLKTMLGDLPIWLPVAAIVIVVLAFLLVPMDSQAAVRVFAAAGH